MDFQEISDSLQRTTFVFSSSRIFGNSKESGLVSVLRGFCVLRNVFYHVLDFIIILPLAKSFRILDRIERG